MERRIIHKVYGTGKIIDHAFIGLVPVSYVKFDNSYGEAIVPDSELEPEISEPHSEELKKSALEEVKKISEMNNESLVEEFQFIIRNGLGVTSRRVVFIKREILRRMNRGDVL